jgi:hypothetical protein
VTTKLIEALKRTTDRLNDFVESNREIFGELDPSPYGFLAFCSFLVIASYAPAKEYFPNSVVKRDEADAEDFKQMVIQSMTQSLLARHSEALSMIETEEKKKQQAQATMEQIRNLLNERYSSYFNWFRQDVEKLADDPTNAYANLSAAFMTDVLGREPASEKDEAESSPGSISLGLCLSTTISGLMAFFDEDQPEGV